MLSQLVDLNLLKCSQVIDAVYGNELDNSIKNFINLKRKPFLPTKFNRPLTAGEIGCSMSHQAIYKRMKSNDICLIIEDDVVISRDLIDFIDLIEKLPSSWELVLLGHQVARVRGARISVWGRKRLGKFTIGKPVEMAFGCYGYLINYKGARKLINAAKKMDAPIDHYTGVSDFVNLYAIKHPIIHFSKELTVYSNIAVERELVSAQATKALENKAFSKFKEFVKSSFFYHPIRFLIRLVRWCTGNLRTLKIIRSYR
ncbi:glycosyltransferase involved in LPS biosynthesis [Belliella baltica DSM 15883]|uniref:Glycosyltransferase involved in LPS biosynthesis n=2 Tax=Belliella TaxID=232244 RepID=I3Z6S9_BELBD|nr:glycosyltransferase involved in LPS biosynthesis [Belliella baltica DSM 15883]